MASPIETIRAAADPSRDETPSLPRLVHSQPTALAERDVRAKRPPALSFLLRWATAPRFARIAVLMALDLAGVFMAIYTALVRKDVVRGGTHLLGQALHLTRTIVPFAYLITVLLFARSDMYADRGERPGFTRILATLFQVTVVALIFALVNGTKYFS